MAEHLNSIGVPHEFFSAVDGALLPKAEVAQCVGRWRLTSGEIGCYLSHLAVWRKIVSDGDRCAIILEDDAQLNVDALDALRHLAAHSECFDVVRLSATEKQVGVEVASLGLQWKLLLPTKNPSGLVGYMVSAQGARRLIDRAGSITAPVDTVVDACWQWGGNTVMMVPAPVCQQSGVDSTIAVTGRVRRVRRRGFFHRIFVSLRKKIHVIRLAKRWRSYRKVLCEF